MAVFHGSIQILAYLLLDLKLDPNHLEHNKTVLHLAIELQDVYMVDIILMSNPDINIMSKEHGTPLHTAARVANMKIV